MQTSSSIEYTGCGSISKKTITLNFKALENEGVFFAFPDGSRVEATTENIVAANRNTVLGKGKNNVCFVEHLLASINLLSLDGIEIFVDGPEIPLEDGSGKKWFELLLNGNFKKQNLQSLQLNEALSITSPDGRSVTAHPNNELRLTYLFESPVDGSKTWTTWTLADGIDKLILARTFAASNEHEMLGLKGKLLSYDQNGFDAPLHWPDEPALHKLFDLFGDLSLSGFNPLHIKAHFISYKGGHSLNTQMAKLLREKLH